LSGACWQQCYGLDTLGIRFWKERTPFRWRNVIRITFRRTALPIAELATKAILTRDEDWVYLMGETALNCEEGEFSVPPGYSEANRRIPEIGSTQTSASHGRLVGHVET
jgi:hypothetical protein